LCSIPVKMILNDFRNEQNENCTVYQKGFSDYYLLKHQIMKKVYALTFYLFLSLLFIDGIHAQTGQTGLNQMELLKKFTGKWKNETNKDTVYTAEFKPYGNGGLEFTLISVTQGKAWLEMKQLWGYDKKSDKIVIAGFMKNSPNFMLSSAWFASDTRFEQIPYEFASNPEKAGFKVVFELKSPDLAVRNEIINGKSQGDEPYTRVKN
jgi:hypothetical protein